MSTAEITAYLYGAWCARNQISLTAVFVDKHWSKFGADGLDVDAARLRLGSDMFAYWVRRGMDEAQSCPEL